MTKQARQLNDDDFDEWIEQVCGIPDSSEPNETNLIDLLSEAIRETDPKAKAAALVAVANMSLAITDIILGSRAYVSICVGIFQH